MIIESRTRKGGDFAPESSSLPPENEALEAPGSRLKEGGDHSHMMTASDTVGRPYATYPRHHTHFKDEEAKALGDLPTAKNSRVRI